VGFALTVPAAILLVVLAPGPLLLPALSLTSIAIAALAALIGWLLREPWAGGRITLWDIAGAFAFVGCASGMMSKPDGVLQLFGVSAIP
jgi:hypothetical protein